jgi:hypothetical protein
MMKNVIKKNKDGSVSSELKKAKIDAEIRLSVYYSFDEEIGYYLNTDRIREEFQEQLDEIEEDISYINHERDEHLKTKHMEV